MSELKRIRTEEEYERALAEMNRLFDAEADTPEGERLFLLVLLIGAYEQDAHYIPPPSDEDRLEFLLEKMGRGWISVEQPPRERNEFLVWMPSWSERAVEEFCPLNGSFGHEDADYGWCPNKDVTHWRPLPDPPAPES